MLRPRKASGIQPKETAVLHWRLKPTLMIVALSLVGLIAGFMGGDGGRCGFYW